MIIEDYVSFETAKHLKEKGFDGCCTQLYNFEKQIERTTWPQTVKYDGVHMDKYGYILCPTIQMAMMWLRKKHNLVISTSVTVDGWHSYVSQIKLDSEGFVVDIIDGIDDGNIPNCDTYEESCEAAIKYCLENLI